MFLCIKRYNGNGTTSKRDFRSSPWRQNAGNMKKYNVIVVFNEAADRILMCRRRKDPYKGLSNFVGGKVEKGESGLNAAYRE